MAAPLIIGSNILSMSVRVWLQPSRALTAPVVGL